jgi:hypothetical protein
MAPTLGTAAVPVILQGVVDGQTACNATEPWLTSIRGLGSYTVPKVDVLVSAIFRSQENVQPGAAVGTNGASRTATYRLTAAQFLAATGRPLAAGLATQDVDLLLPGQVYGDRINVVDMRFAKIVRFGKTRTNVGLDLYNLFNSNTPTTYETVYDPATNGARWMQPTAVLLPRFLRVNVQVDFSSQRESDTPVALVNSSRPTSCSKHEFSVVDVLERLAAPPRPPIIGTMTEGKVTRRLLRICAIAIALASNASPPIRAQGTDPSVQTTGGVHTAALETPQGIVRVHVSSDAAAGDTISGAILAEPAGATPQAQEANRGQLNGFVVEWQGQQAPVERSRYEWLIPIALRAGSGPLVLRDKDGRIVSQSSIPVDPVPAPEPGAPSSADTFELPTDGQAGNSAVIRGRFDGRFTGRTVSLGGMPVELLAASPRQLVFRVPGTAAGPLPVRFTSNDRIIDGMLRVLGVRLNVTQTQLLRGQRATLTATAFGLNGITEPVTLTMMNRSAAVVQIENIEKPITITPRQVTRAGTFVVTRRITGVRPGVFQIFGSVGKPPSEQFDLQRSTARNLADWYAKTGVAIRPDALALVQRSVLEARKPLDDFLRQQQVNQGDVEGVFAALLSHYCFDLRDDSRSRQRATGGAVTGPGIRLVALGQTQAGGVEISTREVGRRSFSDFLSDLIGRFQAQQAVGYLFVRSMPAGVPVTIDGQRKGELTNRRFVTSAGEHQVVVASSVTCRQRVTVSAFQVQVVECGG